mmetsp:Transcript_30943/g.62053  ORF Transcript_30943/g.62053 Transcript_30943/m.62053 type:complete len:153 (-) Transcript_30943:594-1052(-)
MIFSSLLISTMALTDSFAFQQHPRNFCNHRTHLPILSSSTNENQSCEIGSSRTTRRSFLQDASAAVAILLSGAAFTQPAEASYSAYTHREEDWKAREENGEIKYSSARDLRRQLSEIAPMNDEGIYLLWASFISNQKYIFNKRMTINFSTFH